MRNISKLALVLTMLATQVDTPRSILDGVAAAADLSAAGVYEVRLNTKTASAVEIVAPKKPDFDAEVLAPLRAAQAEAARKAAEAAAAAARAKVRTKRTKQPCVVVAGSPIDWMRAAGIAESDFGYVDHIIARESGWCATKYNYAGSGAYGLGQALPASKMAKYGADYMTNPVTQLKWADAYAKGRYGTWAQAYAFWTARHYW